MSMRYKGGVISTTSPTVTPPVDGEGGSASGIWSLETQAQYEGDSGWPKPILAAELYAWGYNGQGILGLGDTTNRSSPTQVGALITWSKTEVGQFLSVATKNDGTLWTWGGDPFNYGSLGNNTTTSISSPVQVGALTTWDKIAAGRYGGLATTTDGKLYAWGFNNYGQLGQGNTTNYSSPVQVGALTSWSELGSGNNHTLAVKTDGTLWAWGFNNYGQLGQGNTTSYSSPVQVGSLTNWLKVAGGTYFSAAIKTDGTLWTWGVNSNGGLGLNISDAINRSSPVQVGALTTWQDMALGQRHMIATTTDGKLYAWGYNGFGQLGNNTTTNYSSPIQVGALTTWSKVGAGTYFSMAVKTDGTLWAWGKNAIGQLGQGNTTNRSSPVQVGALTTWSRATSSDTSTSVLAITKS